MGLTRMLARVLSTLLVAGVLGGFGCAKPVDTTPAPAPTPPATTEEAGSSTGARGGTELPADKTDEPKTDEPKTDEAPKDEPKKETEGE